MSEPMSSGEIEDVLSSIRRLVTEDLRPAASPAEPVGKLLLTPALKVVSHAPDRAANRKPPKSSPENAADISRVVSEISAAVAGSNQDWESEDGDGPMGPLSWQAPEWVAEAEVIPDRSLKTTLADAAEAAAVAEIAARVAADAKADGPATMTRKDKGNLDETVLRNLVRDLIREELSGSLGERITRNVRKLVRAEINRAITARNLD